ncbi:MAG: hypothetical protein R6V50_02655, partial [Thermoplasmatota archaeon]
EWWYFDAVFENGYSIHFGLRTYHIKKSGIVQARITIYKDGKVISATVKPYLYSNFSTSNQHPFVAIDGKTVMELNKDHYNKTGEWKYYIRFSIGKNAFDLTFLGQTKGWKIETSATCWAVALPKASVTGSITVDGSNIKVNGIGYHDHNWGYSPTTAVSNHGWFWGRITSDTLNITWSKVIKDKKQGDLLSIINQDSMQIKDTSNFFNIPPSCITFNVQNFITNRKKRIPKKFELRLSHNSTQKESVLKANISMNTYDIHHSRIFTIHYWRFHIKANGMIQVGSTIEYLEDKPQIIEYLLFKT